MGLPGKKLKNITIQDCYFEMCGKVKNKMKEPPQIKKKYPECNIFGWLPAYAFYIRDVENIKLQNITVGYLHGDVRPWIITRDVDLLETENINEIGAIRPVVFDSPKWKTPFSWAAPLSMTKLP